MKKINHYALIPAKKKSSRCRNKNWRNFINGKSLVDFTATTIPPGIFNKVIVSTDKVDYKTPLGIELHRRNRRLATKRTSINKVIHLIIREYAMKDAHYLWLLNPTSPFRKKSDYRRIKEIIEKDAPPSVVSVSRLHPFIWKNNTPLFETSGNRRNTENFREQYAVESGAFFVFNVGHFRKKNSWYGRGIKLYVQDTISSLVDIDTENDFKEAQKIGKLWAQGLER